MIQTWGRFMSADPTIQYPEVQQNFNRYTYVNNNPLSYTDPSGFGFFSSLFKAIGKIIGGVVKAVVGVVKAVAKSAIGQAIVTIAAGVLCGPGCAAAASSVFTAANGGSIGDILKSAAITFVSAQAFGELHSWDPGFAKVVAHGVVGGTFSELGGGDFLSGFLSAGVTQAFASKIGNILPKGGETGIAVRVSAAGVLGGVTSVLGGGKFANGAITGAFSRLFNDEITGIEVGKKNVANEIPESTKLAIESIFDQDISSIKLHVNVSLLNASAQTYINRISVDGSLNYFLNRDLLILEEYYHVIRQWNTGELTSIKYAGETLKQDFIYEDISFEFDAKTFARNNVTRFRQIENINRFLLNED